MKPLKTAFFLLALAVAGALAAPAYAVTLLGESDTAIYRNAFTALKDGKGQDAVQIAASASDRTLYEFVVGLSLAADDSPAPFQAYAQYLDGHIPWPKPERKAISKMAEKRIGMENPQTILAFFAANEVQTVDGLAAYTSALQATNQNARATAVIKDFWLEWARDRDQQDQMLSRFGGSISAREIEARLDNLLWEHRNELAEQLFDHVSADQRKLAQARIALSKMDDKAPRLLAAVPKYLQNQPGLLYERMRWRRKKDDTDGARAMMTQAARDLGHAKAWWDERNALARDLMQKGQVRQAYNLVVAHGLNPSMGNAYTDAEFLAGWLALRFLNQPGTAQAHFTRLYSAAESPVTLARGAYWLARTAEAQNKPDVATNWYRTAAIYGTTYYGQLAAGNLYSNSQISAMAAPIPDSYRNQFENSWQATIVAQLTQAGGSDAASDFAVAWANTMGQEYEFRLLADLALRVQGPQVAVKVAKIAARKKIIMPVEGYPVLVINNEPANAALVHAITRQESQFDANVVSPSNAQGLMQLLPSTARYVAGKIGMENTSLNLFDPTTNVELGSAYIGQLLDRFDGSLPMAIASYNAGPGRISRWLQTAGDPRGNHADMVDWVENIPFDETRNYVQRVMEALQIYRAKFAGGSAPLTLAQDLTGQQHVADETNR